MSAGRRPGGASPRPLGRCFRHASAARQWRAILRPGQMRKRISFGSPENMDADMAAPCAPCVPARCVGRARPPRGGWFGCETLGQRPRDKCGENSRDLEVTNVVGGLRACSAGRMRQLNRGLVAIACADLASVENCCGSDAAMDAAAALHPSL